jgi:hypothetical protein
MAPPDYIETQAVDRTMKSLALLALLLVPGALTAQSSDVSRAVASITESDIYNGVEVIAHDSMLGRATPSAGLDMTARWVADQFRRVGLKPGGDAGSYLQEYVIEQVGPDYGASVFRISGGGSLAFGVDVMNAFGAPSGVELVGGVTILAGAGLPADVNVEAIRGRHLVIIPPEGPGSTSGRANRRLLGGLMSAGPASIIMVSRATDSAWAQQVENQRPSTRIPWQESGPSRFPTILTIREASLARVLAPHGVEIPAPPSDPEAAGTLTPLSGIEFTIQAKSKVLSELRAPNTVGILEGSDPVLKNEYLVYSSHMDHVGVRTPNADGDSIANGADDDASGTLAVVELAEAFAMLDSPPKRSIVFLAVSGEETGLWGSAYFAAFPTVPVEQMVADLNADMISRNSPDSIVVIGKQHSDLGETLDRVGLEHPELRLVPSDDIWPEENFYNRSDHINFARKGVPILFFFNGTHEDYHQVTDEIERMDVGKATRVTKLMFYLGLEVANAPERPKWDPQSYAEVVESGGR